MASSSRHNPLVPFDLMTNLSIGTFHELYLIYGQIEINITDLFLKTSTFNNFLSQYATFLNQYDDDQDDLIRLHYLQDVKINGGVFNYDFVEKPIIPITFSSEGKADRYHQHDIADVRLLAEQLNSKRNVTDFNFKNQLGNVVVNDLAFTYQNNNTVLSSELSHIISKIDELTDSLFGLDLLTDSESIYNLIKSFTDPVNPFHWAADYFESPQLKNGLVHALLGFISGKIADALSPVVDSSDLNYFIPSNDSYIRKGFPALVKSLYKPNNTSLWGHYPVFNRLAIVDNGIKTFDQDQSTSGLVSPYSFLTTSIYGFRYKQAFILDGVPLEFHNNSAIQLHTGQAFKIKSGEYYWKDINNKNNLSIPNGIEKQLLFMDDTSTVFANRLKDISGKKYILEDEVNISDSPFNTLYFFNEDYLYIDNSQKNTTNTFTSFNDDYLSIDNSKYFSSSTISLFQNDDQHYFQKVSTSTFVNDYTQSFSESITNNYSIINDNPLNYFLKYYTISNDYNTSTDEYHSIKNVNNLFCNEDNLTINKKTNIINNLYTLIDDSQIYLDTSVNQYKQFIEQNIYEDNSIINNHKDVTNVFNNYDDIYIDNSVLTSNLTINNSHLFETYESYNDFKTTINNTNIFETNETYNDFKTTNNSIVLDNSIANNIVNKEYNTLLFDVKDDTTQTFKKYSNQFIDNVLSNTTITKNATTNVNDLTTLNMSQSNKYTNILLDNNTQINNTTKHISYYIPEAEYTIYSPSNNYSVFINKPLSYTVNNIDNSELIDNDYKIKNIKNTLSITNLDLTNLTNRVSTCESNIITTNNIIITTNNNLATTNNNLAITNANLASLQDEIITIETDILGINQILALLNNRVSALEAASFTKYNTYKLANIIYPLGISGTYQKLFKGSNTEIYWQLISPTSNGSQIGMSNNKVSLNLAGMYEFKLILDLMKYSGTSSKDPGTITISLYAGASFILDYSYSVAALDYNAISFSMYYMLTSNSLTEITFNAYHNINNNGSSINGDPDENCLLLQNSGCSLMVIRC